MRVIGHLLERELRATGFLAPEAGILCGLDRTTGSDVLFLTDADAMRFDAELSYDLAAKIDALATPYSGTGSSEVLQLDDLAVDGAGNGYYDLDADGIGDSDFRPNGGVVIVDRNNPARGSSCGIVQFPVDQANRRITVDFLLGGIAAAGDTALAAPLPGDPVPDLVAIPAHVYRVNNGQLERDGAVIADDVEDLQIAVFFDLDGDGTVDPGEFAGEAAGPLYRSGDPLGPPGAASNADVREIRVSFVVRTQDEDQEFGDSASRRGQFQVTENRVAPVAPNDGYRRRVYTTRVRPRNVGHRVKISG
jgi:hypothetical protein